MEKEYLELLKRVLIDYNRTDLPEVALIKKYGNNLRGNVLKFMSFFLSKRNIFLSKIVHPKELNYLRDNGRDWPTKAESMIGLKRMDNIQYCVENIIKDDIKGDLIETGVWRGGATIFMKAILRANKINDKKIWLADSFEGLPKPDKKYTADEGDKNHTEVELRISIETVINNFKKYDLLDDNVRFLKGWFKDTLPTLRSERFSLLRLDGDMYESTMDSLTNLYPLLNSGGYIIIDDWGAVPACQIAVKDYRALHNINEEIIDIDGLGVFWRKN